MTRETTFVPLHGRCQCGTVHYTVHAPATELYHCHCSMCRRNHGAGFVTWFAVPYTQFRIVRGSGQLRRFVSSDHGTRSFCGICGSSLFCESTRHPEYVDIVLANMDSPIDREPQMQPDRVAVAAAEAVVIAAGRGEGRHVFWRLTCHACSSPPLGRRGRQCHNHGTRAGRRCCGGERNQINLTKNSRI